LKTLLKVLGILVVCLVLLLVVLSTTGFGPHGNTPGLWLKGDLVTTPVADWSFTDKIETVNVQTRTWYLIPHSVTTYCVAYNGQLYLTSVYRAGLTYPHGRSWNEDVARDPRVRIKIGKIVRSRFVLRDRSGRESKCHRGEKEKIPSAENTNDFDHQCVSRAG
jgi:hypothetical protein